MSTFMGTRNAINNKYENANVINSNYSATNYSSGDGLVSTAFAGIDTKLGLLNGVNEQYISTNNVILNSSSFGKTVLVDTITVAGVTSITAPNPNGIADQKITFVNSPSSLYNVVVTTPTGTFGNASTFSTITLYPGDVLSLMTVSALGYQPLNLSRSSGLGNCVVRHLTTSEILNLGSTPITLVGAPGARSTFLIRSGNIWLHSTGNTAYAGGNALALRMGSTQVLTGAISGIVTQSADTTLVGMTAYVTTVAQAAGNILNQALVLGVVGNTNFTTGTGTLDIIVEYSILTFPS